MRETIERLEARLAEFEASAPAAAPAEEHSTRWRDRSGNSRTKTPAPPRWS